MSADLSWFAPQPKQQAFINTWDRDCCYAGGVGAGKTLSGGVKTLMALLQWPGTVGLVARQSYRALEDTTKRVILEGDDKPPIIPPELIAERSEGQNRYRLVNGSEIIFRSFQDFNMEKIRSLNLGFLYLDEATEATENVWLSFVDRLRHPIGPRTAWATTNPNGHDWVWRKFHPDANPAQLDDAAELGAKQPIIFIARSTDNPHLAPDYIARLRSMPREWQKRFVDASFDTAAGQIWDEWDRHVHVVAPFDVPYDWQRVEALDHGRRNPTSYLQAAVDRDGNVVVYDGYHSPGEVEQHASIIAKMRGARKWGQVVADPSVYGGGATGRSVAAMYLERGIAMRPGANDVTAGLLRVAQFMHRQPGDPFPEWHQLAGSLGPNELGAPKVFVMDAAGTTDLRREIPDYRHRDLSPQLERDRDQPEEPRKKDDHACDALRYLLMSLPAPISRAEKPREAPRERRRMPAAGIQSMSF